MPDITVDEIYRRLDRTMDDLMDTKEEIIYGGIPPALDPAYDRYNRLCRRYDDLMLLIERCN